MPGHVLEHLHLLLFNLIVELLHHGCVEHGELGTAVAVLPSLVVMDKNKEGSKLTK